MASYRSYLRSIYFNPKHPASFGGVDRLYKYVQQEGKYAIKKAEVEHFLEEYDTYTLHRQPHRPPKDVNSKIIVSEINEQLEMDLADMGSFAKYNRGNKYILVVIDVFRRFLWTRPLKTKHGNKVSQALGSIIPQTPHIKRIRSDAGREFRNSSVGSLMNKHSIFHFIAHGTSKASFAERVILTLKRRLFRYFKHRNTHNWINVLADFTDSYNKTKHSSTGFPPASVEPSNRDQVWANQFLIPAIHRWNRMLKKKKRTGFPSRRKQFQFKIDDAVRVSHLKTVFERGFEQKFSSEFFKIDKRYRRDGIPIYSLRDLAGDKIEGAFYQHELQRVSVHASKSYEVEKILKTRGRGRNKEVLVKFKGWPKKFAQWLPEKQVKNVKIRK